jgi:hypothetical protein
VDDLTLRLESLFRRYAAAAGQRQGDVPVAKQFLEEVDLLIAQYGQAAINAVLNAPGEARPSISLH